MSADDHCHNVLLHTDFAHALPRAAYFVVNNPSLGSQWVNGQYNNLNWVKGLLDGVSTVDIELARLSVDGLIFIARDSASTFLNLILD